MIRLLPTILMLAVVAGPCGAAIPELSSVAEILARRDLSANNPCALSLTGIVTLVDASRHMLVLQDATGAVALNPDSSTMSVQPGQRVSLKASTCSAYIASLPGFPFQPSGRDVRSLFEAPTNEGNQRLTRMRGCPRPPVTGNYTFWASSDDSSEWWLSTGADPAQARKIALVPTAGRDLIQDLDERHGCFLSLLDAGKAN